MKNLNLALALINFVLVGLIFFRYLDYSNLPWQNNSANFIGLATGFLLIASNLSALFRRIHSRKL